MAAAPDGTAPQLAPPAFAAPPPLEPDVLALLPADDEAPRCSAHAVSIGTDPGGTAISAEAIALIETPLPWPKPVFASGLLEDFRPMINLAAGPTRVLAVVPPVTADGYGTVPPDERGQSGRIPVTIHWRIGVGMQSACFEAVGAAGLRRLFAHLEQRLPSDPVGDREGFVSFGCTEDERAVLICTQGSHDVCCGSEGTRLAADFEGVLRAYRAADVHESYPGAPTASGRISVYRVSHTGGHRFAPTAMTLPDGRMWAGIEAGELASILDRTADTSKLAPRCRGWWGAATGPAQVGERAVFAEVGWPLESMAREVRFRRTPDAWEVDVIAASAGRSWTVTVHEGRTVPTIACRAMGGLPAKPATEFIVTDIQEQRT
ncbi:sucrase ferredoxin [Candidatus Poriferisodalis sp.]|uniref:sucrase ferredoxin n=1 Tax=Candidatus Poriferisodalis sp. TaxID=3101277 RepID=UPI003B0273A3